MQQQRAERAEHTEGMDAAGTSSGENSSGAKQRSRADTKGNEMAAGAGAAKVRNAGAP